MEGLPEPGLQLLSDRNELEGVMALNVKGKITIKGVTYAEVAKVKQIQFADGKTLALNRRERRAAKLYNRVLSPVAKKDA
jgi:hypothetical protein